MITFTGSSGAVITGGTAEFTVLACWFFDHNWDKGFKESLSWKTDILRSDDSSEQRIKLRTYPRRTWNINYMLKGDERRKFEMEMGLRNVEYSIIPSCKDLEHLTNPISIDDTVINISTGFKDYAETRLVAVWNEEGFELKSIISMTATSITVDSPFVLAWSVGSTIAPCRRGICAGQRTISRINDEVGVYTLTFHVLDEVEFSPLETDEYLSIPVIPFVCNFDKLREGVANDWTSIDNTVGMIEYGIQSVEPMFTRNVPFLISGREDIDIFLRFIHYCAGKLSPFWIKTNEESFRITDDISSTDDYITIHPIGYDSNTLIGKARSNLEIRTTSGQTVRLTVTSSEILPNLDERLALTTPVGYDIPIASIIQCNWLELARCDSDTVDIEWMTAEVIQVKLQLLALSQ